jgi:glycosyltransferase involved in cell wall biosynthesis
MVNKYHSGKTVVMFHGWDGHLAEKIIRNPFYGRLFRRIYKKACLILVLCRPFKEQLAGMGLPPEIVKVVTTMYEGNQLPASLRDKKTGETTKILFMARLIKPKGVYLAAEVGRLLVENGYKNIKLFFAGDGPELEGLRKYIKDYSLDDYLEAPGYISGRRKEELLAESDIFLFPTTSEGCPVVVLEAMGAGLAIISTPVGAIPEIIKHEENGFLIAGQDPKAFYEAVKKLIEDKELLKRIQNLNKEKAEGLYEEKVVTKKFEELYLSLIGGKESCAKTTSC